MDSNKEKQRPTYQASNDLDHRTKNASTLRSFKGYLKRTTIER